MAFFERSEAPEKSPSPEALQSAICGQIPTNTVELQDILALVQIKRLYKPSVNSISKVDGALVCKNKLASIISSQAIPYMKSSDEIIILKFLLSTGNGQIQSMGDHYYSKSG
jgi:hypothetical protein